MIQPIIEYNETDFEANLQDYNGYYKHYQRNG
ncbi:Uncharacterised protein [Chryseobacterium nakagawai]|nr:Uncharacterised protein [Chryseobacterium nakagawai]